MTIQVASMGIAWGYRTLDNITSIGDAGIASATYGVRYQFTNDGFCDSLRNQGTDIFNQEVCKPPALKDTTWVRCTVNSGLTLTIGTAGTWQQLNAVVTFGVERSLVETGYNWTLELATDSGGSNIVATKVVSGLVGKIV